jgi:hypothetical protein
VVLWYRYREGQGQGPGLSGGRGNCTVVLWYRCREGQGQGLGLSDEVTPPRGGLRKLHYGPLNIVSRIHRTVSLNYFRYIRKTAKSCY